MSRSDAACSTRAEAPEVVGLENAREPRLLGLEEADDELGSLRRRGVELAARKAELEIRRGHVGERSLSQGESPAHGVCDLALGEPPKAGFDNLDRVCGRKELGDI